MGPEKLATRPKNGHPLFGRENLPNSKGPVWPWGRKTSLLLQGLFVPWPCLNDFPYVGRRMGVSEDLRKNPWSWC